MGVITNQVLNPQPGCLCLRRGVVSNMAEKKDKTDRALNEMIVRLFYSVMDTEEKAIITEDFKNITNNDMHIIEAIGIDEPRRMSDIAKSLNVTVGTLTTNMNSLEKKGYIIRERSETDKRVVLVKLTDRGKKAFYHHRDFHKNMIKAIIKDLDEEEMKVMVKCLVSLNNFFTNIEEKKE
jgi:DNA-binding MarR family transcriptional regulator